MVVKAQPRHAAPALQLTLDGQQRTVPLEPLPFIIGRASAAHLVLPYTFVSRRHAQIAWEQGVLLLRDLGSRHGTYVNATRIVQHVLRAGDLLQFGSAEAPEAVFLEGPVPAHRPHSTGPGLLNTLRSIQAETSDLTRLRWFFEAARELSSAGAVADVIQSLLMITLTLAQVECGYVFLADATGDLVFAHGMDANGQALQESRTLSQTVVRQAVAGSEPFLVTDTLTAEGANMPESLIAHHIRAVICIPLRQCHRMSPAAQPQAAHPAPQRRLLGVLYLDSRFEPARLTEIDSHLLCTIAREAAALVENAQLAQVEQQARSHQEELQIAAAIQQGLMTVRLPKLTFAEIQAESLACKAVGGDFFDIVPHGDALHVALVDVSGKGISAALLASTLQGMLYVQLQAGQPLDAIAAAVNDYLCHKNVGKYATMLLLRLHKAGQLEYMNCGHIPPRLCLNGHVMCLPAAGVPVGLLTEAEFRTASTPIEPGSRLLLVSDGFTEAEDAEGNCFGEEGLDHVASCGDVQAMLRQLRAFCAAHPLNDDCTIVQVTYKGPQA